MKTKTQELTGAALDWAVAKCEGFRPFSDGISWIIDHAETYQPLPKYSTDWSEGGPIIERKGIITGPVNSGRWCAEIADDIAQVRYLRYAETPLIAAMRCHVASEMGEEIDIPEELL